ncbi:YitT family protein [bacterium]|nr:YitT family protein [bacterium]
MTDSMKKKYRSRVNYLGIIIGSAADAFGYAGFLIPNKLNMGGVAGIAIILHHLTNFQTGLLYFLLNLPVFCWAFFRLEKKVLLSTFISVGLNAFFIDMFGYMIKSLPVTEDLLLAVIYGSALSGLGIGITYRSHGSLGGTDLLAQIIHTYFEIPFGQIVILLDALVIVSSAIIFKNANLALMPLIGLFILGKVVDVTQEGISSSKVALIITEKPAEIKEFIFHELKRGVTLLQGKGGYSEEGKAILLCAFTQSQHTLLKQEIKYIDQDAFIMIGTLDEVLGEGFEKSR